MTEAFTNVLSPTNHEYRLRTYSHEVNPSEVSLLRNAAEQIGITLPKDLTGIQGGGILATSEESSQKVKSEPVENIRAKAIVLGKTAESTELNAAVHFPTNKERLEFGANLLAYQGGLGEYLRMHWKPEEVGMNPLQGVIGNTVLEDGRYVTGIRFRKNYEMLGVSDASGAHELNTRLVTPKDLKHIVRVLNRLHVDSKDFSQWVEQSGRELPKESWVHPDNKNVALRGKEWWISPNGDRDRMSELTEQAVKDADAYAAIDPHFDAPQAIRDMIQNNLELFPRQDGSIDNSDLVGNLVVVHGALHPRNIHIRKDGIQLNVTVSGGDRAQGMGLKGQMVDWLVTSAAGSPQHQQAILDEFIRLNPSEKDRRGLAMHVLYRSILEGAWFRSAGKINEANSLTKLSYDILKGNGIWRSVTSPLASSK